VAGNFWLHLQSSRHINSSTVPQYRSTAAAAANQFEHRTFLALYILLSYSQFVATFNAGLWHAENRTFL
jgi:hypothetical protein